MEIPDRDAAGYRLAAEISLASADREGVDRKPLAIHLRDPQFWVMGAS